MRDGLEIAIRKLEEEIAKLPKGYITQKTVSGTRYPYHQWQENGHKSSVFLHEDEVEYIASQIDYRKTLEEKLKSMKKTLKERKRNPKAFHTSILTGSLLDDIVRVGRMYPEKRDIYKDLDAYLHDERSMDVFILYGLRNTGKTIMIAEAIADMTDENRAYTAFIHVDEENVIDDLIHDLDILRDQNYRTVFIDEVTAMPDFINNSAVFTSLYAWGMKIVLTGTDSLGFMFAHKDDMFERSILLHTNHMSFPEWSRLFHSDDIDEYLRHGGMMSYSENVVKGRKNISTTSGEYVYRAIAMNIENSVVNYRGVGNLMYLETLHAKGELLNAIERIVENMNHAFLSSVVNRDFRSSDLSLTMRNLSHANEPERRIPLREYIDMEDITGLLMEYLDIINIENREVPVKQAAVNEIERYLYDLDVIEYAELRDIYKPAAESIKSVLLTQPRLRYIQVMALIDAIGHDNGFVHLAKDKKEIIISALETEVLGRMLEEAVMLSVKKNIESSRFKVFKLRGEGKEFDLAIQDSDYEEVYLFEVKHSDKRAQNQKRYLLDEDFLEEVDRQYGKVMGRYVLYRGESFQERDGIKYLNVAEFLNKIENIELPFNGIVYTLD